MSLNALNPSALDVSRSIPGLTLYRLVRLVAGPAVAFRLAFWRAAA